MGSSVVPIVLVVDDEALVRGAMARVAKEVGYQTIETDSIDDLNDILDRADVAHILLDLSIGRTDAVEVLQGLAARGCHSTVTLVSGHDQATMDAVREIGSRRGLAMGPTLHKPFRPDALRAALAGPCVASPTGEMDLSGALAENRIELWYQPVVDLTGFRVVAAEGLARLRRRVRPFLSRSGQWLPEAYLPCRR